MKIYEKPSIAVVYATKSDVVKRRFAYVKGGMYERD